MPALHLHNPKDECLPRCSPSVPLCLILVLTLSQSRRKDQTCNDGSRSSSFRVSMLNISMYTTDIKWALSPVWIFKLIHPFPGFNWEYVDTWKVMESISVSLVQSLRYPVTPQLSQILSICFLFPLPCFSSLWLWWWLTHTHCLLQLWLGQKWEAFLSYCYLKSGEEMCSSELFCCWNKLLKFTLLNIFEVSDLVAPHHPYTLNIYFITYMNTYLFIDLVTDAKGL